MLDNFYSPPIPKHLVLLSVTAIPYIPFGYSLKSCTFGWGKTSNFCINSDTWLWASVISSPCHQCTWLAWFYFPKMYSSKSTYRSWNHYQIILLDSCKAIRLTISTWFKLLDILSLLRNLTCFILFPYLFSIFGSSWCKTGWFTPSHGCKDIIRA